MPTRAQANRIMRSVGGPQLDRDLNLHLSGKDPKDYSVQDAEGSNDEFYEEGDADEIYQDDSEQSSDFSGYDWGEMSDG